jgi:hypothetical protein
MKALITTLLGISIMLATAVAQHRVPYSALSNGGAVSSSGAYRATAIIGQPAIAQLGSGAYTVRTGFLLIPTSSTQTGVSAAPGSGPMDFGLGQNFPNPFNPSTTIPFTLKTRCFVTLRLFDGLGREVATVAQGNLDAGRHTVTIDASALPSGVYFYRLEAGPFTALRKATLLK